MIEITTTDNIHITTKDFYNLIADIMEAWKYGINTINIPLSNGEYINIDISQITNIKILL